MQNSSLNYKKLKEEYNENPHQYDNIELLKKNVLEYKDEILNVNEQLDERNERLISVSYKADNLRTNSVSTFKLVSWINFLF